MKKILVTFTFGISLRTWRDQGLLDRELLIYKKMIKEGYKIGFLTYGDNTDLGLKKHVNEIEVYPIYSYLKKPKGKILQFFHSFFIPFKLASIFKEYDIYKTNQMLGAWVAVIAKFLYKKRLIVRCGYEWLRTTFRESGLLRRVWITPFGYLFELVSYTFADRIIVSSQSILDFIRKFFRPFAHKVIVIPNFIDTENFRKGTAEHYKNRILYVGRLNRRKNLINLLKAIKDMEIGLDIIGEGNYFAKLNRFIETNNLDVRFLGRVPNAKLPVYINRYPIFALVSYFEDNPKTLLEAMACERVIVGSKVEGIKDLIDDNVSGILVSTDADGIREGMEKTFRLTEDKRIALGKGARELVIKTFSVDKVFEKERSLYEVLKV